MLKVDKLVAKYGTIEALHGISIEVGDHEIVALVGANGAGKTTLLNAISGTVHAEGSIEFNEKQILKQKSADIARMGILQVPEGRHVFPGLTVRENLMVGTVARTGIRFRAGNYDNDLERVFEIFPRLKEREKQLAWSMSGGEQQMLAIGRALMGNPKLLMLDEPSMGLAPILVDQIFEIIKNLNKAGTTILLVEQNAQMALSVADRAYVIETGKIALSGTGEELAKSDEVRKAYLGG